MKKISIGCALLWGLCTFDAESSAVGCDTEINKVVKRVVVIFKIILNDGCLRRGCLRRGCLRRVHCIWIVGLHCWYELSLWSASLFHIVKM